MWYEKHVKFDLSTEMQLWQFPNWIGATVQFECGISVFKLLVPS